MMSKNVQARRQTTARALRPPSPSLTMSLAITTTLKRIAPSARSEHEGKSDYENADDIDNMLTLLFIRFLEIISIGMKLVVSIYLMGNLKKWEEARYRDVIETL